MVSTGLMGTSGTSEHFVLQIGLVVDTVIHGNVDKANGWTGTGCACYLRDGAVMSRCTIQICTPLVPRESFIDGRRPCWKTRASSAMHRHQKRLDIRRCLSGWRARLRDCEVALNHHASGTQHNKVCRRMRPTAPKRVITNNTAGYNI